MEIDGTNPIREIKVERTHRIKRTGQDKEEEQDAKRSFSHLLELDMDEVELHGDGADEKGEDLQVSSDIVSISGPGLVGSETLVASTDIVDLNVARELAQKINDAQPETTAPAPAPAPAPKPIVQADEDASVDTLA